MNLRLEPGQVLSKDIITINHILLVPKGTRLTIDIVEKLKNFSINENGIAIEHSQVVLSSKEYSPKKNLTKYSPQKNLTNDSSKKILTNDTKITNIEEKVESIKQIFVDNINPKEIETIAYDTATDIVEEIVEFDGDTNICINDLRTSDEYTYQHSVDVSILVTMLGKNLGLSKKYLNELAQAGLLHDIGKQKIPNEILNKPARLTDKEMAIMRTHTILGYEIANKMHNISENVKKGILQHHEKIDGSGYPFRLKDNEITMYAKMLSIVDVYDALTQKRCYKAQLTSAEAFSIMSGDIRTFDRKFFIEFFKHITFYPLGSQVILTDGTIWEIIDNKNAREPKVIDKKGNIIDLATSDLKIYGIYSETMMKKWKDSNI